MKSLATKYRPTSFDQVVEQGAIRDILTQQIESGSFQNAYLFTGGAGTGKTTCARIFADQVNKSQGNPIEIDAASNNGVEDVRKIRDDARMKSIDSVFKIYIIDECHMLSTSAWNAMLKLLEEPPAMTVFIFCTTDPQKIPATILSRVQRYDFRRISFNAIVDRLNWILDEESAEVTLTWSPEALQYIAKIADGGMRDAITLLDKAISYSSDISLENVVTALGTVNYDDLLSTIYKLCQSDLTVISNIDKLHFDGVDLKQFIKQLLTFTLDLCKYRLTGSFDSINIPNYYEEQLTSFSDDDFEFIKDILLDAIVKLNNNIKWETAPKPLIQATLMLVCSMSREVPQ